MDLPSHYPAQLFQKEFFAVLHTRTPIAASGGIGIIRNVFK
jgi:hypothetical protein